MSLNKVNSMRSSVHTSTDTLYESSYLIIDGSCSKLFVGTFDEVSVF